jgi:hypothetical protein
VDDPLATWVFALVFLNRHRNRLRWKKEAVDTIFSVCSDNQHKIQEAEIDRLSHTDGTIWAGCKGVAARRDNCALPSRQDAAAKDNEQCA